MNTDYKKMKERLELGEAYMICRECGARLYSFDGSQDRDTQCPYKKDDRGNCTDELIIKS